MKSFREYLSEEVLPSALVADGSIDIEKSSVRGAINAALAGVTAQPTVTPYVSLHHISKLLAQYHIILPKRAYLEGDRGVEVYEIRQFGDRMGMTDQAEFIHSVPSKFYLYIQYSTHTPLGVTYAKPTVGGMFRMVAKLVDQNELENLVSMAEVMMKEDAEQHQKMAKAVAPKEPMHDIDDPKRAGSKSAVDTSMRKSDKKLSADSLDEAMTRKQKDMAVRRFMSHDPDAGERILAMGKKERAEKKSFASAKKEIKRLKEEQIDEISKQLVKSYQKKSEKSLKDAETLRTVKKRHTGLNLAHSKLTGDKYDTAPASGNYKSPKVMAKEETLDELKKSTLGSYIKKAHVSGLEAASKGEIAYARKDKEGLRAANKTGEKREQGIERAANKLAKEEYEKVEAGVKKRPGETHTLHRRNPGHKTEYHTITTDRDGRKSVKTGNPKYIKKHWDKLEEKHLTPPETRKKEEIVMSMKKGLPGFKKRYGERAKEVMYATATKRAKQVAEKLEFDPSTEVPRNT